MSTSSKTQTMDMDDTIDRMIGTASTNNNTKAFTNTFIPSSTFQGAKPGYYFGTVASIGLGYHIDPTSSDKPASTSATNQTSNHKKSPFQIKIKTGEELLAEAEQEQQAQAQTGKHRIKIIPPTSIGIQQATQSLEMSIHENSQQRQSHPTQPESFMESELLLHNELQPWKDIAVSSKHCNVFPFLIEYGTLQYLLHLLQTHENNDVGMTIVSIFVEWMDVELLTMTADTGNSIEDVRLVQTNLTALVQEFIKEDGLSIVVSNLSQLTMTQEEDVKGIDDTLTLIEALMELDALLGILSNKSQSQSLVYVLLSQTKFVSWLFQQIQSIQSFQPIKLHCTELLATILQHEDAASFTNHLNSMPIYATNNNDDTNNHESKPPSSKKPKLDTDSSSSNKNSTQALFDGMEILLIAISHYRKKNPISEDECEYLENCFSALSASLLHTPNVTSFLALQGPELMIRCIREKVHAGAGALRVLYFCISGSSSPSDAAEDHPIRIRTTACEYLVQVGALKLIFPLFMGRKANLPKPASCSDAGKTELIQKAKVAKQQSNDNDFEKNKYDTISSPHIHIGKRAKRAYHAMKDWIKQIESHAIHIVYNLTRYITSQSPNDAKDRLIVKFLERDCEKCDRLIELLLKYDARMRLAEWRYYRSDAAEEAEEQGLDMELAVLNTKLKGGGDLFHCLGAICAFACVESKRSHEHLVDQLKVKNSGISLIRAALEEFSSILEEGHQKSQLVEYLSLI